MPNTMLEQIYAAVNQGLDAAKQPRTLANQLDTMVRLERAMTSGFMSFIEQQVVMVLQKEIVRIQTTNPQLA